MRVVVLCEGRTEAALKRGLRDFINQRTSGSTRLGIDLKRLDGSLFRKKLGRLVALHASDDDVCGIIALTDVYPNFKNAADAKKKLQSAVSEVDTDKFRAHAAQFETEAWIIPFWDEIAKSLGVSSQAPSASPEQVNNENPPSRHLKRLYARAKQTYEKPIDGPKWLSADRLERAASKCPELKLFLNSILEYAGAEELS